LFGILYIGFMLLFHSSIMSIVRSLIITGKQDKGAK
jgi:hypothetical protein